VTEGISSLFVITELERTFWHGFEIVVGSCIIASAIQLFWSLWNWG